MSLWFRRRALHRAVHGELPPRAHARLRAHLEACASCRAHYDDLVQVTQVARGRPDAGQERARLLMALANEAAAPGEPQERARGRGAPSRRLVWGWAVLPVAAAVAVVVATRGGPDEPRPRDSEIAWRGGGTPDDRAPPLQVILYASRKPAAGANGRLDAAGALRRIGEFPAAGEARASVHDYLQLGYARLAAPAHVLVLGLDDRGVIHRYPPLGARAAAPVPASREVHPLGSSLDLAATSGVGRVRVFAFVTPVPLDEAPARAALQRLHAGGDRQSLRLSIDRPYVAGVLEIVP